MKEHSPKIALSALAKMAPESQIPSIPQVWVSRASLNVSRWHIAGAGTPSSALSFGGHDGEAPINNTEEYDDISWTNVSGLNGGRAYLGGCGVQSAALATGSPATSEEWNGTVWATAVAMVNTLGIATNCGTVDAALAFGGNNGYSEKYDGVSWTNDSVMNINRRYLYGSGIQDAALAMGGAQDTTAVEEYNSGTWSVVNDLIIDFIGNS